MSRNFSKKQRAELKRLNGLAWERELATALDELFAQFGKWRCETISEFDLSDKLHEFHDHTARDLYKRYAYGDNFFAVPAAIARGIIRESEVSAALLEKLDSTTRQLQEDIEQ